MNIAEPDAAAIYEAARRRARLREKLAPWLLVSPALAITLFFFAVPLAYMVRMSFNEKIDQRFYVPGFTFDHYSSLLTDPAFSDAIWTTAKLSFGVSIATTLIGYTFALLVWMRPRRWRFIFIALALCPMLISEISIIFGWWLFFPRNGLLSYVLTTTGLLSDKIGLLYTEYAAFVGLVYLILPFSFFILLSLFDGIDKKLLEASSDLGASPIVTFYEVLLPLTKGGIAASFAQSFIWAIGTYATPSALGPDTLWTIGYLIQEQMLSRHNWPKAAAFSMVLAAGVGVVMMMIRSVSAKRTPVNG